MTTYREILRLKSLGYSERNIALCCSVSRNTVAKVCARAKELGITWPLAPDQTDKVLSKMLFPKEKTTAKRRMPDYEWVRKELLRNGVTRKLLWNEYCEETRSLGELPLMYSQFCYYLQEAEHISRATMHIPSRPGEQVEVDWAGDKAKITDSQTGKCIDACIFIGALRKAGPVCYYERAHASYTSAISGLERRSFPRMGQKVWKPYIPGHRHNAKSSC